MFWRRTLNLCKFYSQFVSIKLKTSQNNSFVSLTCSYFRNYKFRFGRALWTSPILIGGMFLSSQDNKELEDAKKKLAAEDPLILKLKYAKLEEKKHNVEKSVEYYHEALLLLKKYEENKTWNEGKILNAKIYIYDNMANMAMNRLQFDEAEKLFKEVMRGLMQKGISSTENSMVEISLKLSMMYAAREMFDEAEAGYKFCIKAQEDKMTDNQLSNDDNTVALFGLALDSYARFLTLQKRYAEAASFLSRALDIATKVLGAESHQVAVLLSDIASLELLQGNDGKAISNLLSAIQLAKRTDSPDLASYYVNLGNAHLHKPDFKNALENCELARTIATKKKLTDVVAEADVCLKYIKDNQR